MGETTKSCGSCTLCCKLMDVAEIDKPAERWCVHAEQGRGCRIYVTRPRSCGMFDCLWLKEDGLGPEFRPDRVRTVLRGFDTADGRKIIVAVCDRATPRAWAAEPMLSKLRRAAEHGIEVFATAGSRVWQVLPAGDAEIAAPPFLERARRAG